MNITRMMKRAGLTMACVITMAVLAVGCGEEKETPIPINLSSAESQTNENETREEPDNDAADQETRKEPDNDAADQEVPQEPDNVAGQEELDGNVISVDQGSFVICKETTSSDDVGMVAAAPAPGYEEADDLVTVYVNQNCQYQYKTVRNGGVKPEDISTVEGSFGDLRKGLACAIKGSWQGDTFHADSIVMMEFV